LQYDDFEEEEEDEDISTSTLELFDVKDDVFMGYNEELERKSDPMHFKMEINEEEEEKEIDQVVPTQQQVHDYEINCEDGSLDVIVLYVN
jgi:hypothetical protein